MDQEQMKKLPGRLSFLLIFLCGVLLPLITLAAEATFHLCEAQLFDPMPGSIHLFLVALVPLANGLALTALITSSRLRLAMHMNAAAILVSAVYSIVFLPIMPIAVLGILYLGFGLLPLSPSLALFASILSRRALKRKAAAAYEGVKLPHFVRGAIAAVVLFVIGAIPSLTAALGLWTMESEGMSRVTALKIMRLTGAERGLKARCGFAGRAGGAFPTSIFLEPGRILMQEGNAEEVLYHLTGKTCSDFRSSHANVFFMREFPVATPPRLAGSELETVIDARAGSGYAEWVLTVHNDEVFQTEAVTEILLPAGGVVSRLTLWVNGEEQEAAFGGRNAVTQAYERVVSMRRDPALITSSGPDQVRLRMFPVPPKGDMKVRVGISYPFEMRGEKNAAFLPVLIPVSLRVDERFAHHLAVRSNRPFEMSGGQPAVQADGEYMYQDAIQEKVLRRNLAVRYAVGEMDSRVWYNRSGLGVVLVQERLEEPSPKRATTVVIDGSLSLVEHATSIAEAIPLLKARGASVAIAGEEPYWAACDSRESCEDELTAHGVFRSAVGNRAALAHVLDESATPGVIVWLHGPQPFKLRGGGVASTHIKLRRGQVEILAVPLDWGINETAKEFDSSSAFHVARFSEDEQARLAASIVELLSPSSRLLREERRIDCAVETCGTRASRHLENVWVNQSILELMSQNQPVLLERARELARKQKIVTPLSGAVVLETAQQYKDAGLQQSKPGEVPSLDSSVTPDSVPATPEPAFYVMLALVLLTATAALTQRKRSAF